MRMGLTLAGDHLNDDGAIFAADLGAADTVMYLTNTSRNAGETPQVSGGRDSDEPIPDGMVWNMRYRDGRTLTPPVRVSEAEFRDRLSCFLRVA